MGPYILLSLIMLYRIGAVRVLKSTGNFQTVDTLSRAEVALDLRGKMGLYELNDLKSFLLDLVKFSLCFRFKTFLFLSGAQTIMAINDKVLCKVTV